MKHQTLLAVLLTAFYCATVTAEHQVLLDGLRHLRIEGPREWSEFPDKPDAERLELRFNSKPNGDELALAVQQQDVKQRWNVSINGKQLGQLKVDENDMVIYFPVLPQTLVDGENTLAIEQDTRRRKSTDDIRVGNISLDNPKSRSAVSVLVNVIDDDLQRRTPARITVLNSRGALQSVTADDKDLAIRPGTVYTLQGSAQFHLPKGRYTIYAGRGFEYSLDHVEINGERGGEFRQTLNIRREVPTEGYVACDTHVHTLTHSGHGDATVDERMVTLAAEGIELPIATDHNVHIDHRSFAKKMNVDKFFTPVIGNEVTTKIGHFNIFPVRAGAKIPDYKLGDWQSILDDIYRTPNVKVAILNHARDIHGGTTPFGPKLHNAVVGENVEGWPVKFNAMECINSGATQTDVMRLFHDWMGLLNRGHWITPVGSSDSHDVARHFVGQGRTYIRSNDTDAGDIDVDEAVNHFIQGQVMVSYGLLAELTINGKYRSGEIAKDLEDQIAVKLRVLGPHWTKATSWKLYANGQILREGSIQPSDKLPLGVKAIEEFNIPRPKHDVHLVAIASGPGVDGLYWKTAKPYQPTSPDWDAKVIGCSGAVWLDIDGDGKRASAYDYASKLFANSKGDLEKLAKLLSDYDEAVAAQAAHLYQSSGKSLLTSESQASLKGADTKTLAGFRAYIDAWRENQAARAGEN